MWHTSFGDVEIEEQHYRNKKRGTLRPVCKECGVSHRGYSRRLERIITDFGAEEAFGKVPQKLKEHYGISAPTDIVRKITEKRGKEIGEYVEKREPVKGCGHHTVIAEVDGGMVPVVEMIKPESKENEPVDWRKHRVLCWKECRLILAHAEGFKDIVYGGVFEGSVEDVGKQMRKCVEEIGLNKNPIHGVGDGAIWIVHQFEKQFGSQASYLVDMYHTKEYLGRASEKCASENKKLWMEEQEGLLKKNEQDQVLKNLEFCIEPLGTRDEQAPVRNCYRYIKNRKGQLNYKEAIEKGLPIGSGEIESSHRYIVQKRLKIAGAWWKPGNVSNMLALRLCRANNLWSEFWQKAA